MAKGRPKYSPGPLKSIERFSSDEIDQIKSLAKLRTKHGIDLVADLEARWLDVARARLNLADAHFQAAQQLIGIGVKGRSTRGIDRS